MPLINGPALPNPPFTSLRPAFFLNRRHLAGGSGSPRSRLTKMQATERVYVAINATTDTERKALKAVVEPMLISDITTVKATVKRTLLIGTRKRGETFASQGEKSMPLSLAKAKVCRTVEAMRLVSIMTRRMSITMVNPVAPASPVLCWNTETTGYPVGAESVVFKSPIQKT